MNIDKLVKAGINYEEGLNRFLGNSELYEKFLKLYVSDLSYEDALTAFTNNQMDELLNSIHTLKGLSGNLSITAVYQLTSEITLKLRAKDYHLLGELMDKLKGAHLKVISVIKEEE